MLEKLKDQREPFPGKMEKIETYGGTSEVADISPENPKTDVPVLLAPAWACSINVYKPAIETLSSKGRRVIALNHARNRRDSGFDEKLLDQYSAAELTKAFNLLDVLDQKKIDRADVIAHSEGCLNAVIAATLRPDKFRNLVLFAPAGLIGDDNAWRLLKGFAGQRIKNITWQPHRGQIIPKIEMQGRLETLSELTVSEKTRLAAEAEGRVAIEYPAIPPGPEEQHASDAAGAELGDYLKAHPVASAQEGLAMAQHQIHGLLKDLHDKGIGIIVMSGVDDPVFDTVQMAHTISKTRDQSEPDIVKRGVIDGFLSIRGGHGELGGNPIFMTQAEGMLTALEEKQRKATTDTSGESIGGRYWRG